MPTLREYASMTWREYLIHLGTMAAYGVMVGVIASSVMGVVAFAWAAFHQ